MELVELQDHSPDTFKREVKQYVFPSQLAELTDEQKERLREWWNPRPGDLMVVDGMVVDGLKSVNSIQDLEAGGQRIITHAKSHSGDWWNVSHATKDCLPVLSIGQMIEILGERIYSIRLAPREWQVNVIFQEEQFKAYTASDLADALWQAVKGVL